MLRRLFPHPYLSILLTVIWLMLANDFSRGGLVFGLFLGIVIPILTAAYWPDRPKLSNPLKIVEYIGIVIYDIVMANITVAGIVLFKRVEDIHPAWIAVPLDLRSPEAITVLAGTITMTPGTLTADLSDDGHALLVHCLHTDDPDGVRDEIKSRYERRLMEIFQ